MKKYQYILLDWDGNLAKTLDIWLEAFRIPLAKRGFHLSDHEIGSSFGTFIAHAKAWGVQDPEAAFDEVVHIGKQKLPGVELYPDALEVLQHFHRDGKQLALITTSSHALIEHLLQKYDLARLFDVVVAGDDVTHHKPHPQSLEKALAGLNGSKDAAIMIGDSDKDIGAALNFGVDSILFYPPEHKKYYDLQKLKKLHPTYVVEDFKEVLRLV